MSKGNPSSRATGTGQSRLTYALIGLIFVVVPYFFFMQRASMSQTEVPTDVLSRMEQLKAKQDEQLKQIEALTTPKDNNNNNPLTQIQPGQSASGLAGMDIINQPNDLKQKSKVSDHSTGSFNGFQWKNDNILATKEQIGRFANGGINSDPNKPVLGEIPTNGAIPLFGMKHKGTDAIFALACKYHLVLYKNFVGSLRKFGYTEDIVLAVSPPSQMKPGVEDYLKQMNVISYGFDVDCAGPDNCRLLDSFLGYPDPRPFRTFANIRYALYEYWLRQYNDRSYILILDFRDTFFQGNPFAPFGNYVTRVGGKYDLQLFAENYRVKTIGTCLFNSLWIERCFDPSDLEVLKDNPVICSGSTLGSYKAIHYYVRTMLKSMDTVKCWLKGIESDQGYQNYLFYNGYFNQPGGNVTLFAQGHGIVNTIGALNGYRVPAELKGPLDTHWKIRDSEGFILNYDGTRSLCVHQWDRWFEELDQFTRTKIYD